MIGIRPTDVRRLVDQLERDPELVSHLMRTAEKAKATAERIAPHTTGHYARSFVIEVEKGKVILGNKDIAAHLIEWGSAKNPVYAPLRRAVSAIGARLGE